MSSCQLANVYGVSSDYCQRCPTLPATPYEADSLAQEKPYGAESLAQETQCQQGYQSEQIFSAEDAPRYMGNNKNGLMIRERALRAEGAPPYTSPSSILDTCQLSSGLCGRLPAAAAASANASPPPHGPSPGTITSPLLSHLPHPASSISQQHTIPNTLAHTPYTHLSSPQEVN